MRRVHRACAGRNGVGRTLFWFLRNSCTLIISSPVALFSASILRIPRLSSRKAQGKAAATPFLQGMPIAWSAVEAKTVKALALRTAVDAAPPRMRRRDFLRVFAWLSVAATGFTLAGCSLYARIREFAPGGDLLSPSSLPVTREDVVHLTAVGISDDVIIERLEAEGLSRPLAAQDVPSLQTAGVSDRVIAAMREARLVPSSQMLRPSRSDWRYPYWHPGYVPYDPQGPYIDGWDPLRHKDRW